MCNHNNTANNKYYYVRSKTQFIGYIINLIFLVLFFFKDDYATYYYCIKIKNS